MIVIFVIVTISILIYCHDTAIVTISQHYTIYGATTKYSFVHGLLQVNEGVQI